MNKQINLLSFDSVIFYLAIFGGRRGYPLVLSLLPEVYLCILVNHWLSSTNLCWCYRLAKPIIYRIVGNFRWCKFLYIWPKSPQNKISYILISHAKATRPHPCSSPMAYSTAWWSHSRFMSLLASVSIVWLINCKSLWVDRSKIWHNSSCPYSSFTMCSEVKVHAKFSIVESFVVFIFACRTGMRNMRKLTPCEN